MAFIPSESSVELRPAPQHACEPVISALEIIHEDINSLGGPSADLETDAGCHTFAANEVARICGSMCAQGCVRELYHSAQDASLYLPPSRDRETLFTLVSDTLGTQVLFDVLLSGTDTKKPTVMEFKLEPWTGPELKDAITRRVNVLKVPEVMDRFIQDIGPMPDGELLTRDELSQYFETEFLTPMKDDATWDEFARFIKGNLRLGLTLFAYFQDTHRLFRSSDPRDQARAAKIAEGQTWRDGSWSKVFPGFTPADPAAITTEDFRRVAAMMDEEGFILLSDGTPMSTLVRVTENPEEYADWLV